MSIQSSSESNPEQGQDAFLTKPLTLATKKVSIPSLYDRIKHKLFLSRGNKGEGKEATPDPLVEIGRYLRQTRIKQELSLTAIADQTQIPLRLLEALEEGHRQSLPEAIYIRGMIKRFGDLLGIDGTELSHDLPIEEKTAKKVSSVKLRIPLLQLRPIHLYFLYILLVVVSVQTISHILRQNMLEIQGEQPLPQESSLVQENTPPQTTQPVVTQSPVAEDTLVVVIEVKADCPVKVVIDGKTAFDGIITKGTQKTWKAKEKLTVRADDAGKVTVTINDSQPRQLGKPGQLQEVTYRAAPQS
ncbi:MAG: helix-turn-helix domain-containing protein [Microcystaceae cyanobacterium]